MLDILLQHLESGIVPKVSLEEAHIEHIAVVFLMCDNSMDKF